MNISYRFMKLSRRTVVLLLIGATALFGIIYAINRAQAGTGLSATPNFPTPVTVGQTGVAASLTVGNASTADEGAVTLSSITLIPSCGDTTPGCTTADADVFAVSASGTGMAGTSCAGDTFTIAETNATTGQVAFTRNGGPLVLAFGASCTIDFTVDVLRVPTTDVNGVQAGVQTAQLGAASGTSALGNPASGTGTDITTVNKVSPTISTVPSAGGPIGTVLNDTATLSGGSSPTGTVTFNLYPPADATCAGSPVFTQADATAPYATTGGFTTTQAGTYRWTASYSGDANNNPATSGCQDEQVVISKLNSTTVTTLHTAAHGTVANGSSVANGSTIHDSATVSGSGPTPTGNVTFTFFSGAGSNVCDAQSVASGVVALNGSGIADPSTAQGPLAAGSYAFRASYGGDANYNSSVSDCEPFSVNQAAPTISTTPNPSSGVVGVVLNDTAILSDGSSPTGNVTFSLYPPFDATCSGTPVFTQVDGAAPYATTGGYTSLVVGTYHWTASYAGDANNSAATSGCADEPVVISQASPTISTIPSAGGPIGTVLNDTATLSGGNSPTGNVTFNLYPPSDATCSGIPVFTQVDGSAPYATTGGYTSTTAGIYRWTATYAGDANNAGATSGCQDEQVTITQPVSQGCSPGYWKQSQHFGNYPDGVFPNTLFVDVFGENAFPGMTLLQVLQQGGGGLNALGRIIVAAYLNASSVDNFAFTPAQVIADFQAAFPGGDYSALKAKYEALQDPCPLGRNPGPAGPTPTVQSSGVVTGDGNNGSGNDDKVKPEANANSNKNKDKKNE